MPCSTCVSGTKAGKGSYLPAALSKPVRAVSWCRERQGRTLRLIGMPPRLALTITAVAALVGCGTDASFRVAALPVAVGAREWKAPAQTVDGDSTLPLDATSRPTDWVGRGTAVIDRDKMTYTDAGGEVVEFLPDDGVPPLPCA